MDPEGRRESGGEFQRLSNFLGQESPARGGGGGGGGRGGEKGRIPSWNEGEEKENLQDLEETGLGDLAGPWPRRIPGVGYWW